MRGSRSFLVLLVLALGVGAYAYFVESKRDLTDPESRREKVFTIEPGKIEEIQVRAVSGDETTIKKSGEEWQIVAPVAAPADQAAANSLASTLETLEIRRALEDNPAGVSAFGIEPPRYSIAFRTAGDTSLRRLNVGNKTPTGSDLYARVEGQPKLFLISGYLEDTINRTSFDLRDKTALKFTRDTVDTVRVESPGAPTVALARKGGDWRLTAPVDARADSTAVDAILNRASQAQMTSIVPGETAPPTDAELKKFGLDKPQLVATFGAGSTTAGLAIGGKKDETSVYARDLSKPLVFTLEPNILTDLKKTPADLRVKDVFDFRSFNAAGLDVTRAGTTVSLSKSKPAGADAAAADVWKLTSPEAKDVNQTAVTDLLNTLSSFRATTFADQPLATGEETVVVAKSGDASKPTEERVTFRKAGDVVHAIKAGEPGAAVIATADFDKALNQLKELTGGEVIPRLLPAAALLASACVSHTRIQQPAPVAPQVASDLSQQVAGTLRDELNRIFDDPVLARALVAVRVESLSSGAVLYERNPDLLVIPASNMKIATVAAAAQKLGWGFHYETRLESTGTIEDGTLRGDLVVTGNGDPSIGSADGGHALLFLEWADTLRRTGIRRIEGRLIGDDNAFDDEGLGAGWAWDNLATGYAARTGALSYNENAAVVRVFPATAPGTPARLEFGPPGHGLELTSDVTTGNRGSAVSLDLIRFPGDSRLTVRGSVPAGGATITRSAAVDNPTRFFVEGLRLALAERGVIVTGGGWDIDDVAGVVSGARRLIAMRQSGPLSTLAGYAMKESQNFYAETLLKTMGQGVDRPASTARGRQVVRQILTSWGVPADSVVMYDGSGLSRYNYLTARTIVAILRHVWEDENLRGPFLAELPVAGRDGTLALRMRKTVLDRKVQAKTGTISNVRALSGYLDAAEGRKLVFSMIANHFTAPAVEIDAVMERALERLAQ